MLELHKRTTVFRIYVKTSIVGVVSVSTRCGTLTPRLKYLKWERLFGVTVQGRSCGAPPCDSPWGVGLTTLCWQAQSTLAADFPGAALARLECICNDGGSVCSILSSPGRQRPGSRWRGVWWKYVQRLRQEVLADDGITD